MGFEIGFHKRGAIPIHKSQFTKSLIWLIIRRGFYNLKMGLILIISQLFPNHRDVQLFNSLSYTNHKLRL